MIGSVGVINMLVDGSGIRAISRVSKVSIGCVLRTLAREHGSPKLVQAASPQDGLLFQKGAEPLVCTETHCKPVQ